MTIIINNEIELEAYLNGTTFVLKEKPELPSIFHLLVKDGEDIIEEKERAIVVALYKTDEGWYLCFGEVDEQEYRISKQQAQIEYLAMILDEDLGE